MIIITCVDSLFVHISFAPPFLRRRAPHGISEKRSQSAPSRSLKVLGGASLTPARRTEITTPAVFHLGVLVDTDP